jgi:hypothetical protein
MLSGEAALMLMHKKKAMREAIVPDLDRMIKKAVEQKLYDLSGAVTSVMKKPESEYQDDSTDWVKLLRQQNAQADAVLNRIKNRSARNELVRTNTLSEIHIDVVGQADENTNMYVEPGQDGYVEERKT